jgi:hypothetical protein
MNLVYQLLCLFFSFLYGLILYLVIIFNCIYVFNKVYFISFFVCIFEMLFLSLLYFYLVFLVNGGVLHLYFLLFIVFGFLLAYNITKKCKFM